MERPDPDYVAAWLLAFALTLVAETCLLGWLARRAEPNVRRRLSLVVVANLATHPAWARRPSTP
jgi:hypothetical protein